MAQPGIKAHPGAQVYAALVRIRRAGQDRMANTYVVEIAMRFF
jgi:hypothetical protein